MSETFYRTHLNKYDCHLLETETTHDALKEKDKELPSDTHLVRYLDAADIEHISAIRAYKMSDIFDAIHDLGGRVQEITSGYGSIKPKLYGYVSKTAGK